MHDETSPEQPRYQSEATVIAWDARAYLRDLQELDHDDPQRAYIEEQTNQKLTELFELTEPLLIHALHAEVPFPDTRDEVVAEMRRRIVSGLPKFEGGAKYETWAYQIMLNTSSTALKQRSRRIKRQARSLDEIPLEEKLEDRTLTSPEEMYEQQEHDDEVKKEVHELLAGLTEKNRRTMILRFWHELPHSEIARIMGDKTESAPKVRIHRSLKLLRSKVAIEEITEE